jgi:hypothetical protein
MIKSFASGKGINTFDSNAIVSLSIAYGVIFTQVISTPTFRSHNTVAVNLWSEYLRYQNIRGLSSAPQIAILDEVEYLLFSLIFVQVTFFLEDTADIDRNILQRQRGTISGILYRL